MKPKPARTRLAEFIAKYPPPVAAEGWAAVPKIRRLVPGATELADDNWTSSSSDSVRPTGRGVPRRGEPLIRASTDPGQTRAQVHQDVVDRNPRRPGQGIRMDGGVVRP